MANSQRTGPGVKDVTLKGDHDIVLCKVTSNDVCQCIPAYPTKPVTGQQSPITDYTAVTPPSCTSFIHILSHIHLDSFRKHRSHNLQVVTFKQFCFLLSSSRLWVEFLDNCLKVTTCRGTQDNQCHHPRIAERLL